MPQPHKPAPLAPGHPPEHGLGGPLYGQPQGLPPVRRRARGESPIFSAPPAAGGVVPNSGLSLRAPVARGAPPELDKTGIGDIISEVMPFQDEPRMHGRSVESVKSVVSKMPPAVTTAPTGERASVLGQAARRSPASYHSRQKPRFLFGSPQPGKKATVSPSPEDSGPLQNHSIPLIPPCYPLLLPIRFFPSYGLNAEYLASRLLSGLTQFRRKEGLFGPNGTIFGAAQAVASPLPRPPPLS